MAETFTLGNLSGLGIGEVVAARQRAVAEGQQDEVRLDEVPGAVIRLTGGGLTHLACVERTGDLWEFLTTEKQEGPSSEINSCLLLPVGSAVDGLTLSNLLPFKIEQLGPGQVAGNKSHVVRLTSDLPPESPISVTRVYAFGAGSVSIITSVYNKHESSSLLCSLGDQFCVSTQPHPNGQYGHKLFYRRHWRDITQDYNTQRASGGQDPGRWPNTSRLMFELPSGQFNVASKAYRVRMQGENVLNAVPRSDVLVRYVGNVAVISMVHGCEWLGDDNVGTGIKIPPGKGVKLNTTLERVRTWSTNRK